MHKKIWLRRTLYAAAVALVITCAGLTYLATRGFTYYDNGRWVHSNLLAVYARSLAGYGRAPIEDRDLASDWGSWPHYAARNFTLDLVGLDYSLPLAWEDIASGPGLCITMRPESGRKQTTSYSTGPRIGPGGKATVGVQLRDGGGRTAIPSGEDRSNTKAWSLTLYRPKFSWVAYVIEVSEVDPDVATAGAAADPGSAASSSLLYSVCWDSRSATSKARLSRVPSRQSISNASESPAASPCIASSSRPAGTLSVGAHAKSIADQDPPCPASTVTRSGRNYGGVGASLSEPHDIDRKKSERHEITVLAGIKMRMRSAGCDSDADRVGANARFG